MNNPLFELPRTMGQWTRTDRVKMVNARNIFDYMNGAGELYLAFRFKHLEVYEYSAKNQQNILVELYVMRSSDDAYGLISQDWGGEPQYLNRSSPVPESSSHIPQIRALYGKGLLRIWSENLYARIMAYLETPVSRKAVLELGRMIIAGRKNPKPPRFLNILPSYFDPDWKIQKNTVAFFRSHLVLNSFYFLSHENILNLDHSVEACLALYKKSTGKEKSATFYILLINYLNPEKARLALEQFIGTYHPEQTKKRGNEISGTIRDFFKIEDGWTGYCRINRMIACIFKCPDNHTARTAINAISKLKKEKKNAG